MRDRTYIINLDENKSIGTQWITLYGNVKSMTSFDNFGIEHIQEEIKRFIDNKNITTNIFRTQTYDSVMCGYFCTEFIEFILKGKSLTDFTNLFSPDYFEKNDTMILDCCLN